MSDNKQLFKILQTIADIKPTESSQRQAQEKVQALIVEAQHSVAESRPSPRRNAFRWLAWGAVAVIAFPITIYLFTKNHRPSHLDSESIEIARVAQSNFPYVIQQIQAAKSVTYTRTLVWNGAVIDHCQVSLLTSGFMRVECTEENSYQVIDLHNNRVLVVFQEQNFATRYSLDHSTADDVISMMACSEMNDWNLRFQIDETAARKENAVCFVANEDLGDGIQWFRVWVDPSTWLPVFVELEQRLQNGDRFQLQMTGIQFDQELDESQFSLSPPAGYRLEIQ